ncbi:MAG TPA: beta-ketoacyl-ACP synthase III [Parvularcula sp.]|nr:beta-ketoacyl-ACP synthase III [Parvularcula sp.]HBS31379.1 beta-ketoacyl-ACP synthase III [Parvularcula sp.]
MPAPDVRIIATGLHTPPERITNAELVSAFNAFVERFNKENAAKIAAGAIEPLQPSSPEFIEKASGIKARHVVDKAGILDPARMAPRIAARPNEEISVLAEMAVKAAESALKSADLGPADIDGVLCAASNMQRAYPAMAVEVQAALGVDGFAFDMNVACASAAFGIETGLGLIRAGARRILMVNPEICSAHLNFRNRDSHFIFGDVATAVILERIDGPPRGESWDIVSTRLKTVYSNNIRNNFGFLNHAERADGESADPQRTWDTDKLFIQQGRKVFKDVVPMVGEMIAGHLADNNVAIADVKRLWLHQANLSMNELIARRVLGREASRADAPIILDEYANTSSAGSIIAFHKHRADLKPGDIGVISGFGAGYSAGSVIVRRAA